MCNTISFNIKTAIILVPLALIIWGVAFFTFGDRYSFLESSTLGVYFMVVGTIAGLIRE